MTRQALCICGHWDDKHHECIETDCADRHGEAWHVVCDCGCSNFQTDYEMMHEMENEEKVRRWERDSGK